MKAKTSTEVLQAAKWMIDNVGWCKKVFTRTDEKGKVLGMCATQAIFSVEVDDAHIRVEAHNRLEKVMDGSVVGFNDADKTRKRDIIRAFNKAIEKGAK